MKALGMIEVYGRVGAIEGLDSAVKAANVSLVNMIRVGGGYTTFLVEGDVGAVKAAIDAAAVAADKVGQIVSCHVIPRPHPSVRQMIDASIDYPVVPEPPDPHGGADAKDEEREQHEKEELNSQPTEQSSPAAQSETIIDGEKELQALSVDELRSMAREQEDISLSKQEIKFAKKNELIQALVECSKI